MKTYTELTTAEIRIGFKAFCSNRKQVDSFGLNYFIGMMIGYRVYQKKRDALLTELFILVESDKYLFRVIESSYTKNKIAEYYNKIHN
ncbi:hypothetical protein UFOVP606_29 [uncultured Caudovirales phage]|uniref:Uncharacterized protein n=1 Tax=uncultured Caudovirales phage TaxID=2100421 RepID=A0A6J5N678_9CAUD|nr:hypothetical protein UFOVP606_29 [uncultured Caudovirales phage]